MSKANELRDQAQKLTNKAVRLQASADECIDQAKALRDEADAVEEKEAKRRAAIAKAAKAAAEAEAESNAETVD